MSGGLRAEKGERAQEGGGWEVEKGWYTPTNLLTCIFVYRGQESM